MGRNSPCIAVKTKKGVVPEPGIDIIVVQRPWRPTNGLSPPGGQMSITVEPQTISIYTYIHIYIYIPIYIYIYITRYTYIHINIAIHNKNLWKKWKFYKKGELWQKCKFEKNSKFPKTAKMDKMQNSNFGGYEQKRLKKVCACIINKLSYCTLNGRQFVGMFTTYIKEIPIFLNIQHKKPPNAIFSRY